MNPVQEAFVPLLLDGVIVSVDADAGTATARLPDLDDMVTDALEVLVRCAGADADYAMPAIGDEVMVLLDGTHERGLILGSYYRQGRGIPTGAGAGIWLRQFADGTVLRYDGAAHHLQARLAKGGTVSLEADGGIHLKGPTTVEGTLIITDTVTAQKDLTAQGTVTGKQDVVAGTIGLGKHIHDTPDGPSSPPQAG